MKILLVLSAILSCQTATAETNLDQILDRGLTPDQVVNKWGLTPDQMPWAPFECPSQMTAIVVALIAVRITRMERRTAYRAEK